MDYIGIACSIDYILELDCKPSALVLADYSIDPVGGAFYIAYLGAVQDPYSVLL